MQDVRVLVVDDFEEWRRELCATIQEIPDLQVVGEAADGLEAIQKTKDLRPDLILLDIGLPPSERDRGCATSEQALPGIQNHFCYRESFFGNPRRRLSRRRKCVRDQIGIPE